jgi:hypothetical protein
MSNGAATIRAGIVAEGEHGLGREADAGCRVSRAGKTPVQVNLAGVVVRVNVGPNRVGRADRLALVAAAAALGLATLGAILFLDADEAQAAAVLTDNTGALDPLGESLEELLEALGISQFNSHVVCLFSFPATQAVVSGSTRFSA